MTASYRLKIGIRETAFQATYAMRWSVTWAHIFIDCPTCDQSIGLKFDSNLEADQFPDEKFVKIVHDNEWDFDPNKYIACPECQKVFQEEADRNMQKRNTYHA